MGDDGNEKYSCVVKVACCCCLYCMDCLTRLMEMINDLVYTDTALNGTDYPAAITNVVKNCMANADKYTIISYAMAFLKGLGMFTITLLLTWGTFEWVSN